MLHLKALLLIGLLSSLWRFLCFAGSPFSLHRIHTSATSTGRNGAGKDSARSFFTGILPESDTLVKTPEDLDIGNALPDDEVFEAQVTDAELERRYAEGMRQSSLSPEFQEALGWAGTAQEVFDLLDRRREYLLLADALAALKKLIKKLCTQSCPVATGMVEGKSRLKDGGGLIWLRLEAEQEVKAFRLTHDTVMALLNQGLHLKHCVFQSCTDWKLGMGSGDPPRHDDAETESELGQSPWQVDRVAVAVGSGSKPVGCERCGTG
ncbi:unnamed protein product [Symbiodinium natans]|uniref:Uncharacterized protein n=1 Tax=Symbiodinium natans TaxID=878477 RepID=A0A812V6J2_9DINO|nr:unnamed protein product [Symbiodinium natans]